MTSSSATLHMLCGKIAAGKSTLAARLAGAENTVLISEDTWLGALFADQMATPRDYVRYAARLRTILGPHVAEILQAGVSVVLDFPANTVDTRAWMRDILQMSGASGQLHVLDVPDEVCLTRLHARNAQGDHPFAATEAQFRQFSSHFVAPTPEEGFTIIRHSGAG